MRINKTDKHVIFLELDFGFVHVKNVVFIPSVALCRRNLDFYLDSVKNKRNPHVCINLQSFM